MPSTKNLQVKQKTASKRKPSLPFLAATYLLLKRLYHTSKINDRCCDSRTNYDKWGC